MEAAEGAQSFDLSGDAYDKFMGRYSRPLALRFADAAGVSAGLRVLDVGCGPGALTGVLADRLGAAAVAAIDPSPSFVAACSARYPDVDVRLGRAEEIPFDDDSFDSALSQLVFHFVSDPAAAAGELRRVVRSGGTVAACVWDFDDGMEMLRCFMDAAREVDSSAPDQASVLRFGGAGEVTALFDDAGFESVEETTLRVSSSYENFDELWSGFLAGVGPAGSFLVSLPHDKRAAVRESMFRRVGSPTAGFTLGAVARCAVGRTPD